MKKILVLALAVVSLTSCENWWNNPEPPVVKDWEGILVNMDIDSNTTWYSDSIYTLQGRISVINGATLTIQPGCLIKAQSGVGAVASSLVIARGSKIMAEGTAGAPIIFTSVIDSIGVGELESPNLDADVQGLWGGVVILGYAPISAGSVPLQIEGIPSSDESGLYGGTDSLDNSGIFSYVSIRHGGTNIGQGNELNGLTLGGVGSGTIIDNIEVVGNQDDGIEFFGGCVDAENLLVWAHGDDGLDIDQGYSGLIQNYVVVEGDNSDHALELDGGEGPWNASFSMWAGSLISTDGSEVHCRDGAMGFIQFSGGANIVLDSGTQMVVDTLHSGAQLMEFDWTLTHAKGKL